MLFAARYSVDRNVAPDPLLTRPHGDAVGLLLIDTISPDWRFAPVGWK
jgi:hypothetical protein